MRSEMKKYRKLLVALSFSAALVSCDDGRIYPETVVSSEGKTVILEGVVGPVPTGCPLQASKALMMSMPMYRR